MTASIFITTTVFVWRWKSEQANQLICLVFAVSFKVHHDKREGDMAAGRVEVVFERGETSEPHLISTFIPKSSPAAGRGGPERVITKGRGQTQKRQGPVVLKSNINTYTHTHTHAHIKAERSAFISRWLTASGFLSGRAAFLITLGGKVRASTSLQARADEPPVMHTVMHGGGSLNVTKRLKVFTLGGGCKAEPWWKCRENRKSHCGEKTYLSKNVSYTLETTPLSPRKYKKKIHCSQCCLNL